MHSRTPTATKLLSSEPQESLNSASRLEGDSSDMKEYESSKEENFEEKNRAHTLRISVGRNHSEQETNFASPKKKKESALFGALSKSKASVLLKLNVNNNKIEEHYAPKFLTAQGLTEDQMRQYKEAKCLFRYNDGWRVYWDLFIMFLAIWNCFIIPVEVAFTPSAFDNPTFIVINSLINLFFAIDIFVVFRTSYVDPYTGIEVFDGKRIAIRYISGRFWIDLLATIPFDTIGLMIFGDSTAGLQLFGVLKLIRIARLSRIITYMNVKEDFKLTLKLTKLIFFLIMYLHLLGCAWYFLIKHDEEWIPPLDYVYVTTNFFNESTNYKYWMSIYHAVLVLTGNDIGPRNSIIQVTFVAVFVTFGAIVNAYIFGELVVLVSVMNAKTSKFVQKLDICNTAMKNLGVPKDLQSEVIGYLTYTQGLLDSQQELETFLGLISPSLKEKVIKFIFQKVLQEDEIFKGREQLVDSLTRKLTTKIYQPEEHIVTQGEEGDKIYFIAQGGCDVYIRNRHKIETKVNTLERGALFGEVALLNGCKRTATVKANNYSTIAYLDKEQFNEVFSMDSTALELLKARRSEYNDEWKCFLKDNLKYIGYIKNVSDKTVEELSYCLREENVEKGTVIFRAGSPCDKLYFVADGEVDIMVKVGRREALLDTLYQACNIGEYGILGDYTHTFTAKAKSNPTHIVSNKFK